MADNSALFYGLKHSAFLKLSLETSLRILYAFDKFSETKNMFVGYARVSGQDQKTHLQTDALEAAVCEKVFMEKASGA